MKCFCLVPILNKLFFLFQMMKVIVNKIVGKFIEMVRKLSKEDREEWTKYEKALQETPDEAKKPVTKFGKLWTHFGNALKVREFGFICGEGLYSSAAICRSNWPLASQLAFILRAVRFVSTVCLHTTLHDCVCHSFYLSITKQIPYFNSISIRRHE